MPDLIGIQDCGILSETAGYAMDVFYIERLLSRQNNRLD
jgi:hypothetical protein